MLDKNSKRILNMLNHVADKYGIVDDHKLISNNMPKGYNQIKLISTLECLKDLGYLDFSYNIEQEVTFLKLLHKGLNYRNIEWIEIKTFIIRSIIVPIIVSLSTTLLVEWLF
ncbi:hypothetical protein [Caldanaerobius polysaccharolyticus]|uniref:hypothetical protein n=1 Tax=Caldanaerobius polysaccharolyticus TaxID=44256 RepID=UPI00047CBA6E|nr:hypothetical protein [Caldanaerobius polysaccharolyticus]